MVAESSEVSSFRESGGSGVRKGICVGLQPSSVGRTDERRKENKRLKSTVVCSTNQQHRQPGAHRTSDSWATQVTQEEISDQ